MSGGWLNARFASAWSRGGLALLLLCLVVYVPGQVSLPPIDRDESRFAQASRQMAQSDTLEGWAVPRIQDRPRLNKPPLIYWAQASAVRLFGDEGRTHEGIWVYRLPSLLAAIATVLLTWRLGLSMFERGGRPAWLAAAMLAVAPVFAWEAHQARADHLLVLTVVATQFALYRAWHGHPARVSSSPSSPSSPAPSPSGRGRGEGYMASLPTLHGFAISLLFWLSLSAGILTKGPITPLIAALTALTLCIATRRVRWLLSLRPILGLLILAATITPWLIAVARTVGWKTYLHTIYAETIGRATSPMEGHWAPPGYHLVLLPVLFWPGSLLTAAAVISAIRRTRSAPAPSRHASSHLFLLAWVLPAWLVFELSSTKLPHYTMPLYPAIALLSARAAYAAASRPRTTKWDLGTIVWIAIGVTLTVALPIAASLLLDVPPAAMTVAAVASVAAAVCLTVAARTPLIVRTHVAGALAAAAALAALCGTILPSARALWISPPVAEHLRELDPSNQRPIGLVGYHEDSMLFLTRGRAQRLTPDDVPDWLAGHPQAILVLTRPDFERFQDRLRQMHRIAGFNYSTGRRMDVIIAEVAP